ncbi:hypothetical protein Krac_10351 [Ktedonobacter racemifer DSM 44963]|uniref:Uncharacterized protein n=1 Tax=Ktedonobacter racemifer DSM 44963 TaxID=485913 RepID=D6TGS0_KTERA|nr:hypothetical protein Krac_10351 [Ktedonobacter racemifer DSM 44963]
MLFHDKSTKMRVSSLRACRLDAVPLSSFLPVCERVVQMQQESDPLAVEQCALTGIKAAHHCGCAERRKWR